MSSKVIDFVQRRKEVIEKKRRNFERILFQNFLGVYATINKDGDIYPITLVDISYEGCLIQIPWNFKKDEKFAEDTEISMRFYFTKGSFIPSHCFVRYGKEFIDQNGNTYMQYGLEFDQSLPTFKALSSFIDFLYKFAEHSVVDKGDTKKFFL